MHQPNWVRGPHCDGQTGGGHGPPIALPFSGSGLLPHSTLVLRLHYIVNCSMASYVFGRTHMSCTLFRNLRKKVALQPYICMGGRTLGLTRRPGCYIPYEAGERDLRVAKRCAPVTSTRRDASISESLKHELYEKFLRKKKKIATAKIWALSIGTLFWRLAWLLPKHCGRQSSNACYGT